MMEKSASYLWDKYRIGPTSSHFKQFSQRVQACLTRHYITPLPFRDRIRAQQELNTVKSIRRKLKRAKLTLCETDKGGNLYVGQTSDIEQKAADYRAKTGAYRELSTSPIEETLRNVTRLLDDLYKKTNDISDKQYNQMMPMKKEVELAYIYYKPKTHKVMTAYFFHYFYSHLLIRIQYQFVQS